MCESGLAGRRLRRRPPGPDLQIEERSLDGLARQSVDPGRVCRPPSIYGSGWLHPRPPLGAGLCEVPSPRPACGRLPACRATMTRRLRKGSSLECPCRSHMPQAIRSCGCVLAWFFFAFFKDWRSVLFGVLAAPEAPETLAKNAGFRPPPC